MKYYKISELELAELINSALHYCALDCGGVDNWEWCSESVQHFIDQCNEEDDTDYTTISEIVEDEIARYELLGED